MARTKIHGKALDEMREALRPLDTPERRERYRKGEFPRADKVKDLDKRYRWDLWWDCELAGHFKYEDMTDAHIDTALRSIVPKL